ncbi:MAG: bifunctional phosphoribosylaminoimidazolecarboxamide formyltransferase/IMP cyclohydrolase [Bacteroidetes bacterium]|nr:MAG: bifunctional phosphoribosylaminoimidazolecarboxamide formyltransferase/IMP cyclohydrolase [Bacteroidota bacterium]
MNGNTKDPNVLTISRALISVSDKTGIVEFAAALHRRGVEIISTGGTHALLQKNGIPAKQISEVTGFPEILDGRVKTLHPAVHAGLLAVLDDPEHRRQLQEHGIAPIDLVVVNLYPFEETVAKPGVTMADAIENIDIGGPTMLRSAAKNHRFTAVIVDSRRYEPFLKELEENGGISESTCFELAAEVFRHTAHYDAAIAAFLTKDRTDSLPETLTVSYRKQSDLRYGENPHQSAALYGSFDRALKKLHGKELSFNNIIDAGAAAALAGEFDQPAAVIIKHTNPCGAATGATLEEAYRKAFATDTKAPFGGIIAVNRPLDMAAAAAMNEIFTEIIIAPSFEPGVLELLMKKKDRRLLQASPGAGTEGWDVRSVPGGLLVQTRDRHRLDPSQLRVVTQRRPTEDELEAMLFTWTVVKHVKSNAIVYGLKDRTLAVGAGQMSRVDSSKIAVWKSHESKLSLTGSAVASDAFFPFADGLLEAVSAGATAVIQPGGSIRDEEVIAAADRHGIAMVFTGIRHFKH